MNNTDKLNDLYKILYSKLEQVSTLIGENFKATYYDYFVINKLNLDEKLQDIRNKIKNNSDLEVLVLQKDILNSVKEILDYDMLSEIEKEKKNLKILRYVYMSLIGFFLVIGLLIYGGYFVSLYKKLYSFKNCNITNLANGSNKEVLKGVSGDKKIGGENKEHIQNNNFYTGNFILAYLYKINNQSGNLITGEFIIKDIFSTRKIKLLGLKENINFNKVLFPTQLSILKLSNKLFAYLSLKPGFVLSGDYKIKGLLSGDILLLDVVNVVSVPSLATTSNVKNSNKETLANQKKLVCPYTGYIYVNVRALNLRKEPTKYGTRLVLLSKGTKLQVLSCEKNKETGLWWYKVKVINNGKIGWACSIGLGK